AALSSGRSARSSRTLDQIVVGAAIKPGDAIVDRVARREHQDGNRVSENGRVIRIERKVARASAQLATGSATKPARPGATRSNSAIRGSSSTTRRSTILLRRKAVINSHTHSISRLQTSS